MPTENSIISVGNNTAAWIMRWRRALKVQASFPDIGRKKYYHHHGHGESGIAGVGKYVTGGEQIGWAAYYQKEENGKRRQVVKRFPFCEYGRYALACAAQWREVMVKEAFGR